MRKKIGSLRIVIHLINRNVTVSKNNSSSRPLQPFKTGKINLVQIIFLSILKIEWSNHKRIKVHKRINPPRPVQQLKVSLVAAIRCLYIMEQGIKRYLLKPCLPRNNIGF